MTLRFRGQECECEILACTGLCVISDDLDFLMDQEEGNLYTVLLLWSWAIVRARLRRLDAYKMSRVAG